ncbi:MAG: hypothetical protein QW225_11900 [Candidatus Jordarchaeales archaeon]
MRFSVLVLASLIVLSSVFPAGVGGCGAVAATPDGFAYRAALLTLIYENVGELIFTPVAPPDYGEGNPALYALYYYYELRGEFGRRGALCGLYYMLMVHYLCEVVVRGLPEPYDHFVELYLERRGEAMYALVLQLSGVYGSFEQALSILMLTVHSTRDGIVEAIDAGDAAALDHALRFNLLALASCIRTAIRSITPSSPLVGKYWLALAVIGGGALGGFITAEVRRVIRRMGKW